MCPQRHSQDMCCNALRCACLDEVADVQLHLIVPVHVVANTRTLSGSAQRAAAKLFSDRSLALRPMLGDMMKRRRAVFLSEQAAVGWVQLVTYVSPVQMGANGARALRVLFAAVNDVHKRLDVERCTLPLLRHTTRARAQRDERVRAERTAGRISAVPPLLRDCCADGTHSCDAHVGGDRLPMHAGRDFATRARTHTCSGCSDMVLSGCFQSGVGPAARAAITSK
jgi:hypothetical protein